MVAEMLAPERDFRRPGCGVDCRAIRAMLPGQFGRSELMLHDPEAHEAYGRRIGNFKVGGTDVLVTGRLSIDFMTFSVAVDGETVEITPTERRLLLLLARRVGAVVSQQDLLTDIWGSTYVDGGSWKKNAHLLRVNMNRIRSKLGPAGTLIRTHKGLGYRLELVEVGTTLAPQSELAALWRAREPGRWAKEWDACRDCGTTARTHEGRGLCNRCRNRRGRQK